MEIILESSAYSINDYYYNNRKHGKRAEAKQWEYQINWLLKDYEEQFKKFRDSFGADSALSVEITFYHHNFFTKSGKLNSKIYDLSNCEKVLIDLLLNPVNHGPAPYKSPNLNIDDCKVIKLLSQKLPANRDYIRVVIEQIAIPNIL